MKAEPMKTDLTYEKAVVEARNGFKVAGARWPKNQFLVMASSGTFQVNKLTLQVADEFWLLHSTEGKYQPYLPEVHEIEATDWTSFV